MQPQLAANIASGIREPKTEFPTLDYLRAAAIVAVVITHAGARQLTSPLDAMLRAVWVSYHVPVFLFVSGVLYYAAEPVAARRLGPRLGRILVPYVIASCAVWVLGVASVSGLQDALHQLAIGRALGIYYYVFLIVTCIPLVWVLSRLPRTAVLALLAVAIVLPMSANPATVTDASLRNPLNHFWAYFLAGWTAAGFAPELARWRPRLEPLLWSSSVFGIGFYWMHRLDWLDVHTWNLERVVYSFAVIVFIWLWTAGRPAPSWVRFLSRASFTIYLYHVFFIKPLRVPLEQWPVVERNLLLTALGLLGSCALVWLSRRILGSRSRLIVGA